MCCGERGMGELPGWGTALPGWANRIPDPGCSRGGLCPLRRSPAGPSSPNTPMSPVGEGDLCIGFMTFFLMHKNSMKQLDQEKSCVSLGKVMRGAVAFCPFPSCLLKPPSGKLPLYGSLGFFSSPKVKAMNKVGIIGQGGPLGPVGGGVPSHLHP